MWNKYTQQSLIDAVNREPDSQSAAKQYSILASRIRRHRQNPCGRSRLGHPSCLTINEESYFVALLRLLPE